ncbi:MAG TPA: DUF3467 domain-containing protein [Phycisphaerae bacterium]|nr:DUF3467 domain-containing protein [Phycisphaerae bacterium]HUU23451.1 DUF3467 domain-containing protein [Phycisphaerae bacterium]
MADNTEPPAGGGPNVEDQAREQTGQQQVRVRVDERSMGTAYANAFRANGTAEEVMLDFGVNLMNPAAQQPPEIIFQVHQRVILNYYSAKRLAITLGQLIRRHEQDFGELELDVNKRRKGGGPTAPVPTG